MQLKFNGAIVELKNAVKTTGIQGKWQADRTGKHTFRSDEGGILNWWQTSKTVQFQGKADGKSSLEQSVGKLLARKKCIAKPTRTAAEKGSEPRSVTRSQVTSLTGRYCVDTTSMKRIKKALSSSGDTTMLINNSLHVVSEIEFDHYCSLVEWGSEIHIREL